VISDKRVNTHKKIGGVKESDATKVNHECLIGRIYGGVIAAERGGEICL
jgi:hypothetical protein